MDRLRALAEADGFFTRQDAFGIGHDDRSIRRSLRSRLWVRVRPGAYTFPDLWPAADPVAQHLLTGRAVSRRFGPKVALSHTSGALAHGLLVWDTDLSQVHVTRLDRGAGRCEAGVVHHEGLTLPADVAHLDGGAALHPARCALETAALGSAEAAARRPRLAPAPRPLRPATSSTRRTPCFGPGRGMQCDPGAGPDGRRARGVGGRVGAPGTSATPTDSRHPSSSSTVLDHAGRLVGTTDLAWPEHGLLGEFDGRVKYERYLRSGETPGDAVFREKRREDRLCELLGWRMIRLVWADLHRPAETAARISRMLRAAA